MKDFDNFVRAEPENNLSASVEIQSFSLLRDSISAIVQNKYIKTYLVNTPFSSTFAPQIYVY